MLDEPGLELSKGHWEFIRGYMEEEPEDLIGQIETHMAVISIKKPSAMARSTFSLTGFRSDWVEKECLVDEKVTHLPEILSLD